MEVPSPHDFEAWERNIMTDDELSRLEKFYGEMVRGSEALGPRFELATLALRRLHDSALQIQRFRK